MKRNIKHRFAHKDPEKDIIRPEITESKQKSVPLQETEIENLSIIKSDLKRTIITISIFVLVIIALYFAEIRFDLISILTKKLGV